MKTKNLNKVIKEFEVELEKEMKSILANNGKDKGKLHKSIDVDSETYSNGIYITLDMEDYGQYVDEGRKPGTWANVDAIRDWVKSRTDIFNVEEKEVNGLAYVINRKIKEEGIEPVNFINKTLDKLRDKYTQKLTSAYADDIIASLVE